jgi:hypothetical protein
LPGVDDTRKPYSEALVAIEELKSIPMPVGLVDSEGMLLRARVKATEAAALASLAAADASYALRNELEGHRGDDPGPT